MVMAVTEDKITQCVRYYKQLLTDGSSRSASRARDSRVDVIIGRAGAIRRSKKLLARLEKAFAEAGMGTEPRLTAPDLRTNERVFILDATKPIDDLPRRDGHAFVNEAAMQSFVWGPSPNGHSAAGVAAGPPSAGCGLRVAGCAGQLCSIQCPGGPQETRYGRLQGC
jgi:hypothetical protein